MNEKKLQLLEAFIIAVINNETSRDIEEAVNLANVREEVLKEWDER